MKADPLAELELLAERLREEVLKERAAGDVRKLLDTMSTSGAWEDIPYDDRSTSRWRPMDHLRRLRALATAHRDPACLDGLMRGLNFWLERRPVSTNWWQAEVNVPQELGAALLISRSHLSENLTKRGVAALWAPRLHRAHGKWTAQNTLYTSFRGVYSAVLNRDPAALVQEFALIRNEARIKTVPGCEGVRNNPEKEGLRADGSFYQHGAALYNGFYGAHFVLDMAFWMKVSEGLAFGFTSEEKAVIQDYVLDAHRWMNRHGFADSNTVNRKISHDTYEYVSPRYRDPVNAGLSILAGMPLPRAEEIAEFHEHMRSNGPKRIRGNRHFWKTDFMVQCAADWQFSTKLWSARNFGTETINRDGVQNRYLPLGGSFLLMKGDEYQNVFPAWDWGRVPGTTTLHRNPNLPSPVDQFGTQSFAGGVSDGNCGLMAYDHDFESVRARKSWFCFPEGVVMLGAGITGGDGILNVETTVNQCHARGPVVRVSDASGGDWIFHDQVGYHFPVGQPVFVESALRSGSWSAINGNLSDDLFDVEMFTLGIHHGKQPQNESYACTLFPATEEAARSALMAQPPMRILVNTPELQVVACPSREIVAAAFFENGRLEIDDDLTVDVRQPCLLLCETTGDARRITVADPTQTLAGIDVRLWTKRGEDRQIHVTLPQGDEAGKSVTLRIGDFLLFSAKPPPP